MARIAGVDIPLNKRVEISLTYIYGIGRSRSVNLLKKAGVDGNIRVKDLSEENVTKIRRVIDEDCAFSQAFNPGIGLGDRLFADECLHFVHEIVAAKCDRIVVDQLPRMLA